MPVEAAAEEFKVDNEAADGCEAGIRSRSMGDGGSLVPISDEQAKAIQEALQTLQGVGGFLKETLGTVPQDLVGYLGGDWLRVRRVENIARILEKANERMKARKAKAQEPVSLSITLPLLRAAADESRDELQDLWARLLAAAADPSRAGSFRLAFIDAAKKMDPLDAAVLHVAQADRGGRISGEDQNSTAASLHVSRDEVDVSASNLEKLGCVLEVNTQTKVISPFGREFLRTVSG
jgi:hypothetical protein